MQLEVSALNHGEISDYCALIHEVYDEYVAPGYPDEGNRTFYDFMTEENIHEIMHAGGLAVAARVDGMITGACMFKSPDHLSAFFVKNKFQGKGIGRMMFAYALRSIKRDNPELEIINVNASPFAFGVYKRLGFVQTDGKQQKDGIIYYPMEYSVRFYLD